MHVVVTGAAGFLGWHTRLRLHALTDHQVTAIDRHGWSGLADAVAAADAVIHIAGANRGTDAEVSSTNLQLADDLARALQADGHPVRVVFAGTIQAGGDSAYGQSKAQARDRVAEATQAAGGTFVDVELPNLFGEHARPNYNSFVATFIDAVITGSTPTIADAEVGLLHVQDGADFLIQALTEQPAPARNRVTYAGVAEVWELLKEFHASYLTGEIPALTDRFLINLFNAYRAALFPGHYPIRLVPHDDPRGRFVETVRVRGGEGQSSVSTTVPGITRGEHYHLRKIERFAVLAGRARIDLRRMFTDQVVSFSVSGDEPVAIDMPTGWAHNITNTGDEMLVTQFWAHELFRPDAPDTFPEPVGPPRQETH